MNGEQKTCKVCGTTFRFQPDPDSMNRRFEPGTVCPACARKIKDGEIEPPTR